MTSLDSYYAAANAAPIQYRRWCVGAGYQLAQRVAWGESYTNARAKIMAVPQYATALVAAGLDDDLGLVDSVSAGTPAIGGLPPAVRAVQSGTAAPGTLITVPNPAALGDLMLAAVVDRGANTDTITVPDGWGIVLEQTRGSVGKLGVYSHVAGVSEPSSYVFQTSANSTQIAAIIALTNAGSINASAGNAATAGAAAHTTPTVTTTGPNALIVRVVATAVGSLPLSWTWPTSTEQYDGNSVATGAGGVSIATRVQAAPGAAGTEDATFAQSGVTYAAVTVAVLP